MKYFLDTEFIDANQRIKLISLAMVCEDGRELYIENESFRASLCTDSWIKDNIISQLWVSPFHTDAVKFAKTEGRGGPMPYEKIGKSLERFCNPMSYGKPEFWCYYGAYDFVILCQIFGKLLNLPAGWPHYYNELKAFSQSRQVKLIKNDSAQKHHALIDARWLRDEVLRIDSIARGL